MKPALRYGLVGCGGFGRFCLGEYQRMENVRCVAVADANAFLARKTADEHGVECCATPAELLQRADIDLVHLATPPSTHAPLALEALRAGRHVLCEKPLALSVVDAEKMVALAAERDRILAVNLMMRHNPLCAAVKTLVERRLLGAPLWATLMNAAQDELLPPDHWFWDPGLSGGIFIEHGVHFFDLFEWWFGPGAVLSAHEGRRPGTACVEQVFCALQHGDSTFGTIYHGFHQMLRRDLQHWTILFEMGVLTMTEWVPTTLRLDATVDDATLAELEALLPHARVETVERYRDGNRHATSRHAAREVDCRVVMQADAGQEKMDLYGTMVRALLADQAAAIADRSHARLVTERNGVESLRYAEIAQRLAAGHGAPSFPPLPLP